MPDLFRAVTLSCDFEESRFSTLLAVILGLYNVYQKMLQNSF